MGEALRYDDRIDTQSKLSAAETFQLIGRALSLLKNVRTLFFYKIRLCGGFRHPAVNSSLDTQNSRRPSRSSETF